MASFHHINVLFCDVTFAYKLRARGVLACLLVCSLLTSGLKFATSRGSCITKVFSFSAVSLGFFFRRGLMTLAWFARAWAFEAPRCVIQPRNFLKMKRK